MRADLRAALFAALLVAWQAAADDAPRVLMKTTMGDIVIELVPTEAPVSVRNFLGYVERGDYDGTIFHRVIPGFMIQAGGHEPSMDIRADGEMIHNEADNGLKNVTGTLALARSEEIDSASRQFFINVSDNTHLDHKPSSCTREDEAARAVARERGLFKPRTCDSFGYAVFGRVVDGMDVVRDIEIVETTSKAGHGDVPVEPIVIESMVVLGPE